MGIDDLLENLFQSLLAHMEIHFRLQFIARDSPVHKSKVLGQDLIEDKPSQRGFLRILQPGPVGHLLCNTDFDPALQCQRPVFISQDRLIDIFKCLAFSDGSRSLLCQIVDSKYHVLRGHRHRTAVRRFQQVVRREQQEPALCLCFHGQGQMNGHLVTVKVCIECSTHQRMQFDRLTFHKDRLKCLNSQSVQRRRTVQHDRMLFDDFLQHIPHFRLQTFHHFLGALDIVCGIVCHQFFHNKGLEQLDRHLLRKTALVDLQLRPDHDNRTSGIIHTFPKQILTETAGFTLQHVGQRF